MNFSFLEVALFLAKGVSTSQNYNISNLYSVPNPNINTQNNDTGTNIFTGRDALSDGGFNTSQLLNNIFMSNSMYQVIFASAQNMSADQILNETQEINNYYTQRLQGYDAQIMALQEMKAAEMKHTFELITVYQTALIQKFEMAQQERNQNIQMGINSSIYPNTMASSMIPNILGMPLLLTGNGDLSPSDFNMMKSFETEIPLPKSTRDYSTLTVTSSSASSSSSLPSSPLLMTSSNKSSSPKLAKKKVKFAADIKGNEEEQPPAKKRTIEKEEAKKNIKAIEGLSPGIKGHVLMKYALDEYKKNL